MALAASDQSQASVNILLKEAVQEGQISICQGDTLLRR